MVFACSCGGSGFGADGKRILHKCGMKILHRTACDGSYKKLRKLLSTGTVDVNERDATYGYTALHFVSLDGNVGAAAILLEEFHADVGLLSKEGESCLHLALKGGPNMIKLLLKHGATSVIDSRDHLGNAPLNLACRVGTTDTIVNLLLDAGANLKVQDNEGYTALHRACHRGDSNTVRLILDCVGVVVDSCIEIGYTPLYSACYEGHISIVRMLIRAGADPNRTCKQGWLEVVKELIAAGAQVDKPTANGQTCLHAVSSLGNLEMVLELISAGADVRKRDFRGKSALLWAADSGRSLVVRALLEAGADANQVAFDGETALMRASELPCVRLLLDAGALPNATDVNGYNALHHCALRRRPAGVICGLFKAGCDPLALNEDDETPADVARDEGEEGAAVLLDRLAENARAAASKNSVVSSGDSIVIAEGEKGTVHKTIEEIEAPVLTKEDRGKKGKRTAACSSCGAITHRRCAGCRVTYYCNHECQRATYAKHKAACKAICKEKMEAKAQRAADRASLSNVDQTDTQT